MGNKTSKSGGTFSSSSGARRVPDDDSMGCGPSVGSGSNNNNNNNNNKNQHQPVVVQGELVMTGGAGTGVYDMNNDGYADGYGHTAVADVASLAELFPTWETSALADVLSTCHGDLNLAVSTVFEWSKADHDGPPRDGYTAGSHKRRRRSTVQVAPPSEPCPAAPIARPAYDAFMSHHLVSNTRPTTASSAVSSLKTATRLIARARLAKQVVAQRNCGSAHAYSENWGVAHLRSYSQEEREEDLIRSHMSREEKIEDGLRLLEQRLAFLRLRTITMEDDGNCQFRALSHELYGHQRWHAEVRRRAMDWMVSHPESYSAFVGDAAEWERYATNMGRSRTWGDELTLRAAAEAFGVVVHVVTTEKQNWLLHYGTNSAGGGAGAGGGDGAAAAGRQLFLCYVSPIHYNVVAPRME